MEIQIKKRLFFLYAICFSCTSVLMNAQSLENLSEIENLSNEDVEAILAVNKMKIYKLPVRLPEDQKCIVSLYKQEYEYGELVKDEIIFGSRSPHKKVVDRKVVLTEDGENVFVPLNGIRIITKEEDGSFIMGIKMGEFQIPGMPVKVDPKYPNKHHIRSFLLPQEYPIGNEIPLLLIGSSWQATNTEGSAQITKFCWDDGEVIEPDLTSKQFNKMPHSIIFGIRIRDYQ